jgi:hypothetical protein
MGRSGPAEKPCRRSMVGYGYLRARGREPSSREIGQKDAIMVVKKQREPGWPGSRSQTGDIAYPTRDDPARPAVSGSPGATGAFSMSGLSGRETAEPPEGRFCLRSVHTRLRTGTASSRPGSPAVGSLAGGPGRRVHSVATDSRHGITRDKLTHKRYKTFFVNFI